MSVKPIQVGSLHGQQIEAERTFNSHTSCHFMRVVAADGWAYSIVVWAAGVSAGEGGRGLVEEDARAVFLSDSEQFLKIAEVTVHRIEAFDDHELALAHVPA